MTSEVLADVQPGALYTLREACRFLRISDATARRWIKDGRLRARKIGRDYRVKGSDVLEGAATDEREVPSGDFGPEHPLLKLIGAGDSGLSDVAERHDDYLAEIYYEKVQPKPK
jgi:excisionase family DNA binding protein